MAKKVAVVGDGSSHGGSIITSGQDGTLTVGGQQVAVQGALHSCPLDGHGVTSITSVTTKSYHNGKLIVTENAVAGCGAVIQPTDRKTYVE
jgi:uncharacterized Zn-binding protein involved in type VI secretion